MKNIFLFLTIIFFISCSKNTEIIEETIDYDSINEIEIQKYLTENNLTAKKSETGLYYIIDEEGTGNYPIDTSNVTVDYKGYFLNGDIFDENTNIDFNLPELILGFREGVQLLKEGGSITLIIPSRLAYGDNGTGIIPGGSVIIFDTKLLRIN